MKGEIATVASPCDNFWSQQFWRISVVNKNLVLLPSKVIFRSPSVHFLADNVDKEPVESKDMESRVMVKTTSTSSVQSTSSSEKPIPSYMRSTSSSIGRAASTPRSKSQETLTRTPSGGGSRSSGDRKASTPMLKSTNKSQPSFDFSGTSSIGSVQKQPGGVGGAIPKQRVNLPSDVPKKFRRNLMSNMDKEGKGVPMKPVPLKVTHKSKVSESTLEEEMILECKKAAVLKAMYMNCKGERCVKNGEGNALYQRLYLRECTKAMMEDIGSFKRQKGELDALEKYTPILKEWKETFAILNCVLESILRCLQGLDDDLNRNSSLVLLKGLPSGDPFVSEEIKKAIKGD